MASSSARTTHEGSVKSGEPHSEKYWARSDACDGAVQAGPTGVMAAATAESAGTSAALRSAGPGSARSRLIPTSATTPIAIPIGHIPCTMAHSHVVGTSHHRMRLSSRVRSQAAAVIATSRKLSTCGRIDRLTDATNNAAAVSPPPPVARPTGGPADRAWRAAPPGSGRGATRRRPGRTSRRSWPSRSRAAIGWVATMRWRSCSPSPGAAVTTRPGTPDRSEDGSRCRYCSAAPRQCGPRPAARRGTRRRR